MKSQKKSSTKVGAKNAAPTGQRQYSNLLRSQAAVVKAQSQARPKRNPVVVVTSKAPVALASQLRFRAPVQKSIANGGLHVTHCEFIGPVYKPATQGGFQDSQGQLFQTNRLRINPGSKKTFNWLATIAPLFENFKFKKCIIHYETRCSTSDRGSIIMSPDYDAADGQIALNEQLLFSNKDTVDDTIWKHLSLRLNPAAMNRLYKAHPNMSDERFNTTSQDEKTIDPAQVFICVDTDSASAFKFGKIFIEYEVEFYDPQNPSESPSSGGFAVDSVGSIVGTSTKPITVAPSLAKTVIENNVITPTAALPDITYPTAVLGRFNKDYQGVLSTWLSGTGITNSPFHYIGSDPLTPAGSGDDVLISTGPAINAALTLLRGTGRINAKEGQFLKMATQNWTTITGFGSTAAGLLTSITGLV